MSTYPVTRALSKAAGRTVVYVDGVDVTYIYGIAIPEPSYLLMEPFAYGSATLSFPQIHGTYQAETFGTGELSWVRQNAPVVIQRVMPDDTIRVDYRGFVASLGAEGRTLTLEVGGEFAGRAAMYDKQIPLVRRVRDVGFWAMYALASVGLSSTTRFGPTTGVELPESGGMRLLAWASDMCAMAQDDSGVQWALMPTAWGGPLWELRQKDYATVDVTFFNDDARTVVSLRDDLVEKTNVWYGTGVAPDGERWQNGRLPGVIQGPAPDYPNSGGATFGVGTVDADTTSGDGVTVMNHKLVAMGLLSVTAGFSYSVYTSKTAAAVKVLQRAARLSVTGVMNPATWDALYDNSATGWSGSDAHIAPLYADTRTQRYLFTANGSVAGLNPDFDPSVLPVHRTIDFGPGVTKAQATAWCAGQAARLAGKNWTGTIRLNRMGGFAGEWAAGSSPASADVLSVKDVRPGMNAWLPLFDGGTLVHVSGVQVDDDGLSATLTVDTLARDLLELSQIIQRNAESRRSVRREWNAEHRPMRRSGNMIEHDELFGWLTQKVACEGDKWTHFPVPAAQAGALRRVWVETTGTPAAFALVVSKRELTRKKLNRIIGNPLAVQGDDEERWWESGKVAQMVRDYEIFYAAGTAEEPCGFWPKKHVNPRTGDTTAHPVTGEHIDDGSWDYLCDPTNDCIVWVAIYPDRDTHVRRGRVLYVQGNDAA